MTDTAPASTGAPLLLDQQRLFDALDAATSGASDPKDIRTATVNFLTEERRAATAAIEADFERHPRAARDTVEAYAQMTDGIVRSVLRIATTRLHPSGIRTEAERFAVLAVGGYGRAEMAPHSDVDLLFLTPYKVTPWAESVIESMLYMLWDLKLKVGHSSRTLDDCIRLGREDITIRTALLEHRCVGGDDKLAEALSLRLHHDLFEGTEAEFIEAKLEERSQRHRRQGGQRYVLEPNVKEGKGGLRDLQTLYWIGKYIHHVGRARELMEIGAFSPEEYETFHEAENYLWAVRCHLHLISGRASDQLTFDMQVEVAERMGYRDLAGRRAVEVFMQDYFRHATAVGDVTRIFLTKLEAQHVKSAPMLTRIFRRRRKLKAPYCEENGRINVADEKAFLSDPVNLLRLFEEGLRSGMLIHPDAMRLVSANLDLIDDKVRTNREAQRIFLDLLLKHGNPERALRRMNELGVLAAFIPEFEPIVAMMQFNMYHSYTVDEHTIQVVSTLAQIERKELVEDLPLSSHILEEGINRKVLYVALLVHDIGKGRPEDHSILGAKIARKVAPRLGLNPEECDTVEWLVRHHLLMSDVAQKRDLSDPRTIRDFAKRVKSRKRLDLLTVLTVCDIRGVGPNVWNNWKATLLRKLHSETAMALEHGLEAVNREQRTDEAKRALREVLEAQDDWDKTRIRAELARHYPPYWQALATVNHEIFARLLRDLGDNEIRIDLHPDDDHDATRVSFALADHPGIFSRLSGALALVGANVVDARTYTSKDGYATAVFWVQDAEGHPYEASKLTRLRGMIEKTLKGEVVAREALKDRDKLKKREREFKFPTHITIDNEGSDIYTIIEVDTRDRPGLLYDLTRALASNNISISSAVIATYGAQVVDSFYVKDMFGLKLHSKSRQEALEKKLMDAIASGAKRAGN
ncbi:MULTISPECIES: [protein-PII] uridylyltransferase [unclassified Thioclava]|uniref:[protein-PII] uridylyltransferase n=1 Tax=unclassified Thioclava TaxID=2621713 RepID=UPI000B543144|nr:MULTISPECIES: [protein-PII] uridylyltransferase [unclassified Thioclava]OWY03129.1 [protein-PII] uridylyltransferase [Thioclava sp. IC9]OWY03797.1 [protein-PII] uridylyltransferase [Thioclava sp. F1Mire-8]OWY09751.1 [protein-PII] uridylyltransferase [Thioclava sp. F42-5]OWY14596.1 [protein-PII] uridylyltransferase [Thioclava sp. F34-6]OWY16248.1 [protein-PII] uridylyltransferase [Thioclava sp. JM3]